MDILNLVLIWMRFLLLKIMGICIETDAYTYMYACRTYTNRNIFMHGIQLGIFVLYFRDIIYVMPEPLRTDTYIVGIVVGCLLSWALAPEIETG
jgi:hypothetical protein